jgi:integrase
MPRRGENIRKRKDERWEGRYICRRTDDGKAVYASVYGKTYAEVKQKLIDAQQKPDKPIIKRQAVALFDKMLYAWLLDQKSNLRPQSYTRYLQLIDVHLAESLGKQTMETLNAQIINQFLRQKADNGRADGKGGLSAGSIRLLAYIISAALEFAALQGVRIHLNGAIHRPAQSKSNYQAMSNEEQARLETYLLQNMDGTKLGVLISLRMGLRIGEVCGLRWDDIDLHERLLLVRQAAQRLTNHEAGDGAAKTKLTTGAPKTVNACRIIPIPADVAKVIAAYRQTAHPNVGGFVIPGSQGRCLDPRTCQSRFHRYLQSCGVRDANYHMLRHAFATRCIESGMDIKTLSELLGHANVSTTLGIYVHSSLEQKRRQMERMGPVSGQKFGSALA